MTLPPPEPEPTEPEPILVDASLLYETLMIREWSPYGFPLGDVTLHVGEVCPLCTALVPPVVSDIGITGKDTHARYHSALAGRTIRGGPWEP